MPDSGMLFLSLACVVLGMMLFLQPTAIMKLNELFNRKVGNLGEECVRHRYVMGLTTFVASYAFFKLALLLPSLRSW